MDKKELLEKKIDLLCKLDLLNNNIEEVFNDTNKEKEIIEKYLNNNKENKEKTTEKH